MPRTVLEPRFQVEHLSILDSEGTMLAGDDGLWVDPSTLRPGDRFVQLHILELAADAGEPVAVEVGLYDPYTGERWAVGAESGHLLADRLLFSLRDEP